MDLWEIQEDFLLELNSIICDLNKYREFIFRRESDLPEKIEWNENFSTLIAIDSKGIQSSYSQDNDTK